MHRLRDRFIGLYAKLADEKGVEIQNDNSAERENRSGSISQRE